MRLFEILSESYYDPKDDKVSQYDDDDTRKPTLTLKHLNKLKKMRATKELENNKKTDLVKIMYTRPSDDGI